MTRTNESLSVTLSEPLLRALRAEADKLQVPIEWIVASLVVDTIDDRPTTASVAAA